MVSKLDLVEVGRILFGFGKSFLDSEFLSIQVSSLVSHRFPVPTRIVFGDLLFELFPNGLFVRTLFFLAVLGQGFRCNTKRTPSHQ